MQFKKKKTSLQNNIEIWQGFLFVFTAFHSAPQIFIANLHTAPQPVIATMNTAAKIKSAKNRFALGFHERIESFVMSFYSMWH